jgi:hypothetical protein
MRSVERKLAAALNATVEFSFTWKIKLLSGTIFTRKTRSHEKIEAEPTTWTQQR